ncbi:MAG: hypothetical protein HY698_06395 [Deltaproteobacteria bacterium]|nr:hypothetical protein [Deltaproteobacteria bacterium]
MRARVLIAIAIASCGGATKTTTASAPPGTTHEPPAQQLADTPSDSGVTRDSGSAGPSTQVTPGSESPTPPPVPPETTPPPIAFELSNEGPGELVFAVDKGWQPVLFAYTGKPPKAQPVLLFPTACTESCEVAPTAMCPVCREPDDPEKRKQLEKEETRREIAPKGGIVKVPWDGKVLVYEKAPAAAGKKKCKCWRKADPAQLTHTIKACGLRPSKEPGKPSKLVCSETQVQFPVPSTPATIKLSFK